MGICASSTPVVTMLPAPPCPITPVENTSPETGENNTTENNTTCRNGTVPSLPRRYPDKIFDFT